MSKPAKPSTDPKWATSPGAGMLSVPSNAIQESGWIKEKPPLQYFNWFMNLVYQWVTYLHNKDCWSTLSTVTAAGAQAPDNSKSRYYFFDATLGNQSITLPAIVAGADDGLEFGAKKIDGSANTVEFTGTVEGEVNPVIENQYTGRIVVAYGGVWYWKL